MQSTNDGQKQSFSLKTLFEPLHALTSIKFYFKVLSEKKGMGLGYLYLVCALLSLPVAMKVKSTINYFVDLEVPVLIGQMPPSYLDSNGTLSAKDSNPSYKEIRNSRGELIILYDVGNPDLQSLSEKPYIIILKDGFIIKKTTGSSYQKMLWSSILSGGVNFEPLKASEIAKSITTTSFISTVLMVSVWFFTMLAVNALIVAFLAKLMFSLIFKIKMKYADALRLSSYACTAVAMLMLLQFYISIPLSLTMMCCIPLIYLSLFARLIRSMAGSIVNDINQQKADLIKGNDLKGDSFNDQSSSPKYDSNSTETSKTDSEDGVFKP